MDFLMNSVRLPADIVVHRRLVDFNDLDFLVKNHRLDKLRAFFQSGFLELNIKTPVLFRVQAYHITVHGRVGFWFPSHTFL